MRRPKGLKQRKRSKLSTTKLKNEQKRRRKIAKPRRPQTKKDDDTEKSQPKDQLLANFGIDLGFMGRDIYEWLWPKQRSVNRKSNKKKEMYLEKGGYLPVKKPILLDNSLNAGKSRRIGDVNENLCRYIVHNYAQERIADIYGRIGFHMRLNPRILAREAAALLGKFGINMLNPDAEDYGSNIQPDIMCLRRMKTKIYALLGCKLLKYHLLLLLRYIRLGIPPEIRDRYISDILTRGNVARACDQLCTEHESSKVISPKGRYSVTQDEALNLTYPERLDFQYHGYPYSVQPFTTMDSGFAPSNLVHPKVYERLGERSKTKLVYIQAALYPESALQIVKNIIRVAGYKCERDLLLDFCLGSKFGSRGARSFVSKLKEELISDRYLCKAAQLITGNTEPVSIHEALSTLREVSSVSGLVKRHIGSGRTLMPINTARMIFKRIRNRTPLEPRDMVLWDIMRKVLETKVPNAPRRIQKQARMEVLATDTYLSPYLDICLKNRGIDPAGLSEIRGNLQDMDYDKRKSTARAVRKHIRRLWIDSAKGSKCEMERLGMEIIDAMASAAGYGGLNNVIILVKMLSKPPANKHEARCRQPGPEFERSAKLEIKDFKYKNLDAYANIQSD
ncbi:hypothetical protein BBOV_I001570 [Babesia bovis T2Bo]|uniref:Uncharacterized protein n=1 Tax=Babesia bovis TaxID=5865 RepID=A7AW13_BABBO|nr:hypothetical protein BBOV_I001570 [Babesia bovis T2Bo]EDO05241.1 hypothetical protein BBOV_I001570 [Babesia bovis T2Bo]|eukprot:XP_001608809.1 hypothetical protein [Babesia bovis T2Bo]